MAQGDMIGLIILMKPGGLTLIVSRQHLFTGGFI